MNLNFCLELPATSAVSLFHRKERSERRVLAKVYFQDKILLLI